MKEYIIVDSDGNTEIEKFNSKRKCREYLMDGIFSCEGAERDHYVNMLAELECGKTTLHY